MGYGMSAPTTNNPCPMTFRDANRHALCTMRLDIKKAALGPPDDRDSKIITGLRLGNLTPGLPSWYLPSYHSIDTGTRGVLHREERAKAFAEQVLPADNLGKIKQWLRVGRTAYVDNRSSVEFPPKIRKLYQMST